MPREDVVCRLRAIAEEWTQAVRGKSRPQLRRLLEELERITPSAAEIRWAGVDTACLPGRLENAIMKGPEVVRLKLLRDKWRRDFLRLPKEAQAIAALANLSHVCASTTKLRHQRRSSILMSRDSETREA